MGKKKLACGKKPESQYGKRTTYGEKYRKSKVSKIPS